MEQGEIIERLQNHATLRNVPPEQIAWAAQRGTLVRVAAGEVMVVRGEPMQGSSLFGVMFVLEGRLAIHVDRGAGRHKAMEWHAGEVSGVLPYSRMAGAAFGDIVAEEQTLLFAVPHKHIAAMIRECYELTAVLVHVMLDRARHFNASDLRDEKLISLGKLAAGLAHELNNPASALARSAKLLGERMAGAEAASRALGEVGLNPAQLAAAEAIREKCLAEAVSGVRSPLEMADREEAMAEWLVRHGAAEDSAAPLAETAVSMETLDRLATAVGASALDVTLRWVAAGCATRRLTLEIEMAATRIHKLVADVKGFTRMDEASTPTSVDVARGFSEALALLTGKARAKGVRVTVAVDPGLPAVHGYAVELNQVWSNLLDNALDAAPKGGEVQVSASATPGFVTVRVTDNGPGIPDDVRGRIFDPFFTTKPVGQGTGLGLDIVRRVVQQHHGELDVQSRAGKTEFSVVLPAFTEKKS